MAFIETLKEKFGTTKPIFTNEILELFGQYSKVYVFDLIKKAEKNKELIKFDKGIYYVPEMTSFGFSSISVEDVIRKKYITNGEDVYGIISGSALNKGFGLATKDENIIEVVSNNEISSKRIFELHGKKIVLRRSFCQITKENHRLYTLLQVFYQFDSKSNSYEELCESALRYANAFAITKGQILSMVLNFPKKTAVQLVKSDILVDHSLKR